MAEIFENIRLTFKRNWTNVKQRERKR